MIQFDKYFIWLVVWFLVFVFINLNRERIQFDEHIFRLGWFNPPTSFEMGWLNQFNHLPSLKLTARTWKWMLGIRSFPFGMAFFFHVSFRECKSSVFFLDPPCFPRCESETALIFLQALKPNLQQLLEHGIFPQAVVGNPLGRSNFWWSLPDVPGTPNNQFLMGLW